jgi:6-phospho-beta-glucosidase
MKVALIGGGGFRAPIVWTSVAEVSGASRVDELVLYDISESRVQRVAGVIEGLRRERGFGPPVRTTVDLHAALEGAGIVFCAIRVGGLAGRIVDERVPLREGVLGQETVGPGGICFALRTVPVMLDIAATVARQAPGAWFLNFTNPAGLVTEAVRAALGDRAVGICDSPAALCGRVAAALGAAPGELSFDYAGLNHLGWLLAVEDIRSDRLPALLADDALLARIEEARVLGLNRVRSFGAIPNEYLAYYESPADIAAAMTGAGRTRAEILKSQEDPFYDGPATSFEEALAQWRVVRDARFGTYMAEVHAATAAVGRTEIDDGSGRAPDGGPGEAGYAAIAAAFLDAVAGGRGGDLILNVANRGRLPFLNDDAVVEVSCRVSRDGPHVLPGRELPPAAAELAARIKEVERLTIRAAVEGSRSLALEAMVSHPVMTSRAAAERILDGYFAAFPELAERLR